MALTEEQRREQRAAQLAAMNRTLRAQAELDAATFDRLERARTETQRYNQVIQQRRQQEAEREQRRQQAEAYAAWEDYQNNFHDYRAQDIQTWKMAQQAQSDIDYAKQQADRQISAAQRQRDRLRSGTSPLAQTYSRRLQDAEKAVSGSYMDRMSRPTSEPEIDEDQLRSEYGTDYVKMLDRRTGSSPDWEAASRLGRARSTYNNSMRDSIERLDDLEYQGRRTRDFDAANKQTVLDYGNQYTGLPSAQQLAEDYMASYSTKPFTSKMSEAQEIARIVAERYVFGAYWKPGNMDDEAEESQYVPLQHINDNEAAIILTMAQEGKLDDLMRYYNALEPDLNARAYEHMSTEMQNAPRISQIATGLSGVLSGIPALAQASENAALNAISKATGNKNLVRYNDPNSQAFARDRLATEARARSLEGLPEPIQELGESAYSAADNYLLLPFGPPLAKLLMSLNAGGKKATEEVVGGKSTENQVAALGWGNAALEYFTEDLPTDAMFDFLTSNDVRNFGQFLRRIPGVVLPEGIEEGINNLGEVILDRIVKGRDSKYDTMVREKQAEGLSYMDAVKETEIQLLGRDTLEAMEKGAMSALLMAGVSGATNALETRATDIATGIETQNRQIIDVVLDEGMKSSDSRIKAEAYALDTIRHENEHNAETYQWSKSDLRRIGEVYDSLDANAKARVGEEAGIRQAEAELKQREEIAAREAAAQAEADRNMTPEEFDEEIRQRVEKAGRTIDMDNPETMNAEESPEKVAADMERRAAAAEEASRTGDTSVLDQAQQRTETELPQARPDVQTEQANTQTQTVPARTTVTPEQAARTTASNAQKAGLSAEDTLTMSNIARDLGANLAFQKMRNSRINGYYNRETGTIVLNQDLSSSDMAWSAFSHEITHHSESAGSYQQVANLAKRFVGETAQNGDADDAWQAYIRQKRRQYADAGINMTQQQAEFEAVANTIEHILGSKEAMEGVAKYSREDAQALLASIDDVLDRTTTNNTAITPEAARLVQAQKALAAALSEVRDQRSAGTQTQTQSQTANSEESEAEIMTVDNTPVTQYSVSTFYEPLGLDFTKDENGRTILLDSNGKTVDTVTEDMIWNSDYGAIIRATIKSDTNKNGILTQKEAEAEVKFLADTIQMMLNTQDIDLIWAVNSTIGFQPIEPGQVIKASKGKSKFSALTANADKQYGTTIDFTTICKKTQAVIDVMSEYMKKHKRGLTSDEVVKIVYDEVAKAGEPVPCPVCYVFSRWVGLGGLFDSIYNMQEQYPVGMDMSEIKRDIESLRKTIESFAGKKFGEKKSNYYKNVVKEQTALQKKQFDAENLGKEPLTAEETARLETITKQIQYMDQWTWLTEVRLGNDYTPVPSDILFDINAGKEFSEKYPATWAYRTSRGPAMGKAATPYADEHIGQIIKGIASPSAVTGHKLGDLSKDPFLGTEGKLGKTALNTLARAQMKARQQNLLNGQRLQSTSDFRYEYALDYLMAFFELQSAGAKAQMYTKVPEMVSMAASCNIEQNLSLMPHNDGYDENGNLIFSDVTGMNAEDAFRYSAMYNCVQPIIVGINAQHVRLCMRDPRITFCIPFHASGGTEDNYVSMMKSVEETVTNRKDFSKYENDTVRADSTPEQKAARSARKKILTGKAGSMTEAEINAVRNNEILSQLHIRFYGTDVDGNAATVDERYLNPDDRSSGRDSEVYKTFLSGAQADKIMPYEFWDKNVTRANERVNGDRFVEYCKSLGINARFSGWSDTGTYNPEMDFTNEDGYWKVIPDRKMYNNDGTYHVQQAVNISDFQANYLLPSEADKNIVKPSRSNDRAKVSAIVDRVEARINNARTAESSKYSIGYDGDLIDAANSGKVQMSISSDADSTLEGLYKEFATAVNAPKSLDAADVYRVFANDDEAIRRLGGDTDEAVEIAKHIRDRWALYQNPDNESAADWAIRQYRKKYANTDEMLQAIKSDFDEDLETQKAWSGEWDRSLLDKYVAAYEKTDFSDIESVKNLFTVAADAKEQNDGEFTVLGENYLERDKDIRYSVAGNDWEADVKEAIQKYGRMKPGEQLYYTDKNGNKVKATDESYLPKGTSEDTRIRGFQRTAIESRNIKADTRDLAVANQYRPTSNEENIQKAIERRGNGSFDLALGEWNTLVKSGRLSYKNLSVDIAFGERLLLEAQQEGNVDAVRSIITDLAEIGTTFGQATQAFSLLKRMSPEGQLIQMERQGKNYYDKLNRKGKYTNKKASRQVKYSDDLGKAADAMERLDEAKKQLSDIQKDKNHTAAQIKAAKAKITSINSEIKQALAELSKTKQDWKHTKGILIRDQLNRRELNREIKATKDRIQNALDEIKKTETDIDRLQGELWALENKETNKKADRDALRDKRKELKRQRDNMMSRIETLSRQIPQLQADIDAMFSQMAIGEDNEADMRSYRDTLRESKDIMKDYLRYVKRKGTVVIPTDLSNEYINAETDEERAAVQLKIERCIADQLPGTWEERIRAVRYISMLFNPTTHLRNISGNAMQYSMVKTRDVFATLGEKAFLRNGEERYHAFLSSRKGADAKYWDAADADYKEMMDIVQGNRTDVGARIEEMRRIFKTDFGEKIRRVSGETLEAEDRFWLSRHYKSAFAQYLKANKLDPANLTDEQLDRARSIAVDQAQKATYRDYSTFAEQLNRLEKSSGAAEFFMGGLMPFKKTPINVLKRGVEYSPLGAIKTVADFVKLKRGNTTVTAADVINDAAQTLTGTLATALGVLLGAMGWAHASPGEDENKKKKNFDKETGMQNYSIEIPGFDENGNWRWKAGTYTVDWLSPFSMPLFIGVRIAEMVKGQDSGLHSFEDIVDAASSIAEPIFQLSMLDGLTSALQSYQTSGAGVSRALLWSVVESYALQFFPTLGSKMARIIDPTQRSTKAFKYSTWFGQDIERLYRRILAKIPGATYALKPVIDQHGDIKKNVGSNVIERIGYNLASPGYYKYKSTDEADAETRRVYEALAGEDPELANSVLPRDINTYWELNGEKYYLNAEEYRKFSETQGKEETAGRKELYASDAYRNATDAEKAAMIKKVIDAAQEKAKIGFFEDIGLIDEYYRKELDSLLYDDRTGTREYKNIDAVTALYEDGMVDLKTVYDANKILKQESGTGDKIGALNQMNLDQDEYDFLYMTKIASKSMREDIDQILAAGGTLTDAISTVTNFWTWDANAENKDTGGMGDWVKKKTGGQLESLYNANLTDQAKETAYLTLMTNSDEDSQKKARDQIASFTERGLSINDFLAGKMTLYDETGAKNSKAKYSIEALRDSDLSDKVKEASYLTFVTDKQGEAERIAAFKKRGMGIDDYLTVQAAMTDKNGEGIKNYQKAANLLKLNLKSYTTAITSVITDSENQATGIQNCLNVGISDKAVAMGYAKYAEINSNDKLSATDKAKQFSMWLNTDPTMSRLTMAQRDLMRDSFVYFMMRPATAGSYDNLMKIDGMSSAAAESISTSIDKLQPLPGANGVTNLQRYNAIMDDKVATLSQKEAAFAQVLDSEDDGEDSSSLKKWKTAKAGGISLETYVLYLNRTNKLSSDRDANGKEIEGRTRKDKMFAAIGSLPLTAKQKDILALENYSQKTVDTAPWH